MKKVLNYVTGISVAMLLILLVAFVIAPTLSLTETAYALDGSNVVSLTEGAKGASDDLAHGGFCLGWVAVIVDLVLCVAFVILISTAKKKGLRLAGVGASVAGLIATIVFICLHVCVLSIVGLICAILLVLFYYLAFCKGDKSKNAEVAPASEDGYSEEEQEMIDAEQEEIEEDDETKEEELIHEEEEAFEGDDSEEEVEQVEDVEAEEPITLKQSIAVTKHNAEVGHKSGFGKKFVADYLEGKYGADVETNRRINQTSTGLPLADTHYAKGDKRKCFVYVYEFDGSSMLLLNADEGLAAELNQRNGNVHRSAFPKSTDHWYSLPLDDSYDEEEVKYILDRCYKHAGGRINHDELTLKESLALAKKTKVKHSFTKKKVSEYLEKYGDSVERNERINYTSTGLPLADTHYVVGENGSKKCFVYVYETVGAMMFLIKADEEFASRLKKAHTKVNASAFPKSKDPWYSVILDDSFSDEEVMQILDDLIVCNR